MRRALKAMCDECEKAVAEGVSVIILSDKGVSRGMAAIPALLAVSALQTYTTRKCLRTQLSLILESAEPRETHHFALLLSCGVTAVNPYMIYELLRSRGMGDEEIAHYNKAAVKGVIKILSKMGISTVQSFRGSHVFEAVGLSRELIDEFFPGTVSRVGGLGLDGVARERAEIHEKAFVNSDGQLESGGVYQYRADGEYHLFNPETIHLLQKACREGDYKLFKEYSAHLNEETRKSTLRSIMKIRPGVRPISINEVESVDSICRRFKTGAMSYGSISKEAHECLAIAMNRLGGRSNTGEGGEDAERFKPLPNGDELPLVDKAGCIGQVRRDNQLPCQRRRNPDKDGTGRKARRGRPASGRQGISVGSQDAPLHARRAADLPAPAPRYILDRGSSGTDLRP